MNRTKQFTLSAKQRIKNKEEINRLYKYHEQYSSGCLICMFTPSNKGLTRIVCSVPKRSFKLAVHRNLLKRRMREAYRLNQYELNKEYDIMFLFRGRKQKTFDTIQKHLRLCIQYLNEQD